MINYSIIIPHKNIPDLLQRCVDSIPQRDDIELIIIDDNSDPNIVNFTQFPGFTRENTSLIFTKEGKGGGFARNTGLEKAKGDWLIFADSDDFFITGFLEYTDKYLDSNYDLVYFGIEDRQKKFETLISNVIANKDFNKYKYTDCVPFGKMIKRSLVKDNNIVFDETRVANDRMFSFRTAYLAQNIFFDKSKIYFYDMRPGSLISKRTAEATLDRLSVYLRQNSFLEEIGQKKYKAQIAPTILRGLKSFNPKIIKQINLLLKKNNTGFLKELLRYFEFLHSK